MLQAWFCSGISNHRIRCPETCQCNTESHDGGSADTKCDYWNTQTAVLCEDIFEYLELRMFCAVQEVATISHASWWMVWLITLTVT
jgi:hypothetical protein